MRFKSDIRVTIIVPVHNSEKYLQQCLESALLQTMREIEVLCIDSSNTDRCFQIIAKLKAQDNRLVYIKDPNSSYGHKINVGIKMAQGDYVAILESDDQMSPDMMEKLYSAGELYQVDMVVSDYFRFFEYNGKKIGAKGRLWPSILVYDQSINYTVKYPQAGITEGEDRKFSINLSKFSCAEKNSIEFYPFCTIGVWAILYRKSFLMTQNILLNESPGASYQDSSFLFLTNLLAASVYYLNEPFYWYRTDNINSSVKDDKKIYEVADEWKFLKRELVTRNVKDVGVWNLFYYEKYFSFCWNYQRLSESVRKLFLKRYLEELRDDIDSGAISREMCDETLYQRTFLLMDDPDKFKEIVNEADKHRSIMTMPETLERLEGREIVVFGAGILGAKVIDILRQNENKILRICDNAEKLHGTILEGLEIGPVAETIKRFPDACYLIVNRKYSEEMKAQMLAEGIPEDNIEIFK